MFVGDRAIRALLSVLVGVVCVCLATASPAMAAGEGHPFSWGDNELGELGTGNTLSYDNPSTKSLKITCSAVHGSGDDTAAQNVSIGALNRSA